MAPLKETTRFVKVVDGHAVHVEATKEALRLARDSILLLARARGVKTFAELRAIINEALALRDE